MLPRFAVVSCFCLLTIGCALFPKDHRDEYLVCPYDTVWNAASDTMKIFPVKLTDKGSGTIETRWIEMEGEERAYGLFRRTGTGFGNRERARMVLTVRSLNEVTEVIVTENRERWHLKGGVTSQATRWWPVEPLEETMDEVMVRINTRLKDQGCTPS